MRFWRQSRRCVSPLTTSSAQFCLRGRSTGALCGFSGLQELRRHRRKAEVLVENPASSKKLQQVDGARRSWLLAIAPTVRGCAGDIRVGHQAVPSSRVTFGELTDELSDALPFPWG